MPKVTLIDDNGKDVRSFNAVSGLSLMENLRNNDAEDLLAICGGLCACATCQIYLDDASYAKVGGPDEIEAEMIDGSGIKKETSRLSCQIQVTDNFEGIRFSIAPAE